MKKNKPKLKKRHGRKKRIFNYRIKENKESTNIMLIDELLKFHKKEIDETYLVDKLPLILAISIEFLVVSFFLEGIRKLIEQHPINLMTFLVILFFLNAIVIDRSIYINIKKKHNINIGSYFFPNVNLNSLKINKLKSFLKEHNLYSPSKMIFLISNLENGVKCETKIVFPFKNLLFQTVIPILVSLLTLLFTFSFSINSDNAIKQFGIFLGYFIVSVVILIILLILVGNVLNQVFIPRSLRVNELKRLLIQAYLEF